METITFKGVIYPSNCGVGYSEFLSAGGKPLQFDVPGCELLKDVCISNRYVPKHTFMSMRMMLNEI